MHGGVKVRFRCRLQLGAFHVSIVAELPTVQLMTRFACTVMEESVMEESVMQLRVLQLEGNSARNRAISRAGLIRGKKSGTVRILDSRARFGSYRPCCKAHDGSFNSRHARISHIVGRCQCLPA